MLRTLAFVLGVLGLGLSFLAAVFLPSSTFVYSNITGVLLTSVQILGAVAPSFACLYIIAALIFVWRNVHWASVLFLVAAGLVSTSIVCVIVLRVVLTPTAFVQAAYQLLVLMQVVTVFPIILLFAAALSAYLVPKVSMWRA